MLVVMVFISIFLISCDGNDQTLFRVQKDGLYGFINGQGELIIEPQYKYVSSFSKDGVACVINELKIVMDTTEIDVDSCVFVNYGYINKKNQRINDNNIITINPNLMEFWEHYGLYKIVEKYNNGTLSFRSNILNHLYFNNDLYIFQDAGTKLLGYKDIKCNIVIEPKYEWCRRFRNGVAIVFRPTNDILNDFDITDSLTLNKAAYHVLNKGGAINTNGELIIDYDYFYIHDFMANGTTWAATIAPDDLGQLKKDWACIDKTGTIIAGPIASGAKDMIYNNDKYPICQIGFGVFGTYYTFIDKFGTYLSDFDNDGAVSLSNELFDDVIRFSDGVAGLHATYRNNTGWFFVDSTLFPISIAYDSILPFSENLAAAKELTNGFHPSKWGFVKKSHTDNSIIQAIPFAYSECGSFHNGLAYFLNKGNAYDTEGYINKQGDVVWQTKRKNY